MKKKYLLLGLGLALFGTVAQAQNGLEQIIVEKYYVSNAADAAASVGTLPVGSVTYRVYADMLPGYRFQALYGDVNHAFKVSTTTSFFNNEDRGSTTANAIVSSQLKNNTVALDSWFSVGASAAGQFGVLKTEDNGLANLLSLSAILNNTPAAIGLGLKTQDGNIAGSPEAVTFVGFANELDFFDATSQTGSSFSLNDHAIAALMGAVGPTAENRLLLGQFTTDGVFRFEFNIQIGTPVPGVSQQYVVSNPVGNERTIPSMVFAPNTPPVVSITAPSNGANIITGTSLNLTANSTDPDASGSVSQVEFFVNGISVGVDASAPYSVPYTAVVGSHAITAVSTDNIGDATTSSSVSISVANNQAPTVSVSAAANAIVADVVAISATAADIDGSVSQVEFFVDNVSVGVDATAPFTNDWTATVGAHTIKATATDNLGLTTTTANANILVAANNPPTAAITSPTAAATFIAPNVVSITASATDADGTITGVDFLVNNVVVGSDATAPYSFDWTSTPGLANITVKSTDNKGAVTTSSVLSLNIADPNALPYEVVTVDQKCNDALFNIPVAAAVTNPVDNVIGYDLVLNYDNTKVTPTGNITVLNNLINSSYVESANVIDAVNGKMTISLSFNTTAPISAKFNGFGNIFTVEFAKTANFASVDTTSISISSLQESYITGVSTQAVSTGKAITHKNYFFVGKLRNWDNNSAIQYDAAAPNANLITNIYGATSGTLNANNIAVNPNVNGSFTYDLRNGLEIAIKKDIAPSTSLFSTLNQADAVLSSNVIFSVPGFTPNVYQMIAMDVNMDGVISSGDYSQIKQRSVLILPEFRQAWNYSNAGVSNGEASKDWLFVDSARVQNNPAYQISTTYPLNDGIGFSKLRVPTTPFTLAATVSDYNNCPASIEQVYKGIMLGDVNGNIGSSVDPLLKSGVASGDRLVFDFTNAIVNGTTVDVPMMLISSTPVNSFDFELTLNEKNVSFNSIIETAVNSNPIANFTLSDKVLRGGGDNIYFYDMSASVASLRFDLVNGSINENDFLSYRALLNGKTANVELKTATLGLSSIKANDNSVQIFPNPTTGILNVVAAENSTVEITDLTGKQVMFTTSLNAQVKTEINVSDFSNGMYIVKVYNENFNTVERIVVNK